MNKKKETRKIETVIDSEHHDTHGTSLICIRAQALLESQKSHNTSTEFKNLKKNEKWFEIAGFEIAYGKRLKSISKDRKI